MTSRRAVLHSGLFAALVAFLPGKAEAKALGTKACKASDISVGKGKVITVSGNPVLITHTSTGFKAFSAKCTHQGCTIPEPINGTSTCPCHRAKFDASTGAVKQGPATKSLAKKTATVSAGYIYIK